MPRAEEEKFCQVWGLAMMEDSLVFVFFYQKWGLPFNGIFPLFDREF